MLDDYSDVVPSSWVSILMVILLGALGSATWEILFKRIYSTIRDSLLSVLTLWKEKQKNRVYTQVSYGVSKQHLAAFIAELLIIIFISLTISGALFFKATTIDELNKQSDKVADIHG